MKCQALVIVILRLNWSFNILWWYLLTHIHHRTLQMYIQINDNWEGHWLKKLSYCKFLLYPFFFNLHSSLKKIVAASINDMSQKQAAVWAKLQDLIFMLVWKQVTISYSDGLHNISSCVVGHATFIYATLVDIFIYFTKKVTSQ